MQRKLTIALVGLTLMAILLVGAGVLLLSSLGARAEATEGVTSQLDAVVEVSGQVAGPGGSASAGIARLARAFGDDDVALVLVGPNGGVSGLPDNANADNLSRALASTLSQDELAILSAGEQVILYRDGTVIGFVLLPEAAERPLWADEDRQLALAIEQSVSRLDAGVAQWFLVSASAVLLTAVLIGSILAGRIVAPVREIERATAAIAAGDLRSRAEVRGEDEIAQLAFAVNTMAADLDRSRAVEQQFLMSVSHDLRTPLSAIRGYAEALSDGATNDPTQAGEVIVRNTDRLERLVKDLLDLAKFDAKQFRIEAHPTRVTSAVDAAVAGLAPVADGHGLSLVANHAPSADIEINIDPDRLEQVIVNLVDNAIKFAGHAIVVTTSISDQQMQIAVSDDGPGIPTEDLPHVFERLYVTQLRPIRAEQSSGLGLAIVKELCAAMGGTVSASSSGRGTTMAVRLPLNHQG